MKKIIYGTLLALLLIVVYACSTSTVDSGKNRSLSSLDVKSDLYWNELTKILNDSRITLPEVLAEHHPALLSQIQKDTKESMLLSFWGNSSNIDSNVKKMIISPYIFAELYRMFNLPLHHSQKQTLAHAGVIHTYGYLFSDLETPYGYKRKRWIDSTLNFAFGFEENSLSPETISGGLLSNVTYFCGMLAFQDKSELALLKNISNEVFTFDYEAVKKKVLIEKVGHFILKTTFVPLLKKQKDETNDFLLIYTYQDKRLGKEWLITAFPVNARSFEGVSQASTLGLNQKIQLRYNAVIEGFPEKATGERTISSL